MRVIATLIIIGDLMMDEGPLEEEDDIKIEMKGHQIEGMTIREVILEEEDPLMIEDPVVMEKPPDDCGLPDDRGPHDDGGPPWKWKRSKMTLKTRTTRPTRTSWTSTTYYSTATPGYIGYNSFGKYIWDSWPVNIAIG